ncbi:MAG: hypothetical protein H6Q20_544 [Bacteroidetes bacterium]|nr:hypothetical protein [Bacteroidota bacterium]
METIKKYFSAWDAARVIKAVVAVGLLIGYIVTKESLYAFGAAFFGFQALLNIGCPGGACTSNVPENKEKQVMKFDKYEPNKQKSDVQ